jgi:hypothetical protein
VGFGANLDSESNVDSEINVVFAALEDVGGWGISSGDHGEHAI